MISPTMMHQDIVIRVVLKSRITKSETSAGMNYLISQERRREDVMTSGNPHTLNRNNNQSIGRHFKRFGPTTNQ